VTECSLCKTDRLIKVNSLTFGVWRETASDATVSSTDHLLQIERDTRDYDIAQCANCEHVQTNADYTQDLFETLYFHSQQEEVVWHESLLGNYQPYQDMVRFTGELLDTCKHIADFGCGTGSLLSAYRNHFETNGLLTFPNLYGIDFNPRCTYEYINYVSADLNQISQIESCAIPQGFDLVCSSHVLEHVVDPVNYLRGLASTLQEQGKIFIEVPDFSRVITKQLAGHSNLINMQHIQYFTTRTLAFCARQAGLSILNFEQVTTGYIPRLLVLLAKPDLSNYDLYDELVAATPYSASNVVDTLLAHMAQKRATLVDILKVQVSQNNSVGLWGVGSDFYLMQRDIPQFNELLKSPKVTQFDYEHGGKQIAGKPIIASVMIPEFDGQVYMLPMLLETRTKLSQVCEPWCVSVIDPYTQDMLDIEGLEKQACQVCQNNNWLPIDTLHTGVWRTNDGQIKRDELHFKIGECKACKHTQIYTPYDASVFDKLYFSSEQQPQMWHTTPEQISPYAEMVEFFKDELTNIQNVADFGCGEGLLMQEIKQALPLLNVVGFDFNIQGEASDITRIKCDLNDFNDIKNTYNGTLFNLITSSHVLEHVINPVMFLHALKSRLHANGLIFIEVPDASACHQNLQLHSNNLVHGQHIHYYTKDSLTIIAARAGLTLRKQRQFVSGDIPRLQMLFSITESPPRFFLIPEESAITTVRSRFTQYNAHLTLLSNAVTRLLQEFEEVALWGVGGDFHQLTRFNPSVLAAIEQGKIILFDVNLKGLIYATKPIQDTAKLSGLTIPTVITPMYWPTRANMLNLSATWSAPVFDPYQPKVSSPSLPLG
jgi:2-polyprenyl-3-methyl-5-hydroxy-6-metoxy-1,4-benzoquinol methylase